MTETAERYDKEAIRERVAMDDLCMQHCGVVLKRSGTHQWKGCCPFHAERTASFTVMHDSGKGWHYHCFGCGAHGDVIDLWMGRMGGNFQDALRSLAGIAGLSPLPGDWKPRARPLPVVAEAPRKEIVWPRLRRLSDATCEELAAQRGLRPEGVMAARAAGLIWGCNVGVLGKTHAGERGRVYGDAAIAAKESRLEEVCRCWVVYDGAQKCMQFRRLDGRKWKAWNAETRRKEESFKSDTLGSTKWPQGVGLIGGRTRVVLVEGGPDLLAAFDFLEFAGRLKDTAVVEAVSASVHFEEEAMSLFAHKRVRIFSHFDKLDPRTGRRAGWEAAARWIEELTDAGAEVDSWCPGPLEETETEAGLPGLVRVRRYPHEAADAAAAAAVEGSRGDAEARGGEGFSVAAGDLNDCALGDAECIRATVEAMEFEPTIFNV